MLVRCRVTPSIKFAPLSFVEIKTAKKKSVACKATCRQRERERKSLFWRRVKFIQLYRRKRRLSNYRQVEVQSFAVFCYIRRTVYDHFSPLYAGLCTFNLYFILFLLYINLSPVVMFWLGLKCTHTFGILPANIARCLRR